jgi:hypothetical protein
MATSISSDEITECTLAGSSGFASCGGLGMPVVDCFFTVCACAFALRFRLAMLGAQRIECSIENWNIHSPEMCKQLRRWV